MTMRKRKKTAAKTAVRRPQAHGGALLPGGVRGNRGGPGRPPSALRVRLREAFADRIPILEAFADGETIRPEDRLRALEILAKYGLGQSKELSAEHIRSRLQAQLEVLMQELPPEVFDRIAQRLREVWQ